MPPHKFFLALALVLFGCAHAEKSLAIVHATVIDATGAPPCADATVVIRGGRIVALGHGVKAPRGARVVDASGKWAVPALVDMHVHVALAAERELAATVLLRRFLSYGVVRVRDMGGDFARIRRLRQARAAGEKLPEIIAAGPFVDGPQAAGPTVLPVTNDREARAAVRALGALGVDFVKVQAKLSSESLRAVADEAPRVGLPFVGHVPESVSAFEVVERGQKSIEHVSPALTGDAGIFFACARDEAALRGELAAISEAAAAPSPDELAIRTRDRALKTRLLDSFDGARCATLFARMVARGTAVVPTLVFSRSIAPAARDAEPDDPGAWMPLPLRARITARTADYHARMTPADYARNLRLQEASLALVGAMHKAGVTLFAGTDSFDAHDPPGESLHDELGLLVAAGLSPLEALQAATRAPARFFGTDATRGTLAVGKDAEILLLDADPLVDIRATRRIFALVRGIEVLMQPDLEALRR